jgi:hypothetical protein
MAGASFWYLATVYSKHPNGLEAAHVMAARAAADLLRLGVTVYSPICHTHPIAMIGGLDPLDHAIWLPADAPFMRAARGLIVLKSPGWESSFGIGEERKAFQQMAKPICFIEEDFHHFGAIALPSVLL